MNDKPIDVLFVSRYDWANVGYHFACALQRVGVNARAIKEFPHRFYGGAECRVVNGVEAVKKIVKKAKCVCIMHSVEHAALKQMRPILETKFLAVFHGGRAYRQGHKKINRFYNPRVSLTLIQTHDLLNLGATSPVWVTPPLDVDKIVPKYYSDGRYRIGHFPRDATCKRTAEIRNVMRRLATEFQVRTKKAPYVFTFTENKVPWKDNLKRMGNCDIYLVSLSRADEKGFPTNSWGYTAIEAAALGTSVITVFHNKREYEAEFGPCPFPAIRNDDDMLREVRKAVQQDPEDLVKSQKEHRAWAERVCSYEAVGERLKRAFEIGLSA